MLAVFLVASQSVSTNEHTTLLCLLQGSVTLPLVNAVPVHADCCVKEALFPFRGPENLVSVLRSFGNYEKNLEVPHFWSSRTKAQRFALLPRTPLVFWASRFPAWFFE